MKTTVDLPEDVLRRAKIVAVERKTTLKKLITQSLLREIETPADLDSLRKNQSTASASRKNSALLAACDRIEISDSIGKFKREDAQRKFQALAD